MSDLVTRAQLVMLARTLNVPVERVQHFERLGAENVKALREGLANVIFDDHADTFKRLSALVPLAPLSIFLPIVQKLVPALVAGRAAGAVAVAHPNKAVPALALLSPSYAADASPYMDPRAIEKIAHLAPPGPTVEIANEILRRKDYATAGLFVDFATPELIRAVEQGIEDDEGLLRAGAYVLSPRTLSNVLRVIIESSPARVSRLIATAVAGPTDLRLATLSVLSRIDGDLIATVGDVLFDETDSDVVSSLLRLFVEEGAAAELLTFAGHLSPEALDLLGANPVLEDHGLLGQLLGVAVDEGEPEAWRGMLGAIERAPAESQTRFVNLLADRDEGTLGALAHILTEHHQWSVLLRILAVQDDDTQSRVAAKVGPSLTPADRASIDKHVKDLRLDDELKAVTAVLAPAG